MNARHTRMLAAGFFALAGVGATVWVVAGPAIERWWKTPKPRPVEHVGVETELESPHYTVMTGDEAALAQAISQVETAMRDDTPGDARVRASLSSTDRAEIARETARYLRAMLSGAPEEYIAWAFESGASNTALTDRDAPDAKNFLKLWSMNASGYVGSPIDAAGSRVRLRYLDGRGPFDAPEDDLHVGHSVANSRFRGLPEDGQRIAIVVETIVPIMHIDKKAGVASSTMLGFWMARHHSDDPWRLWRISLYDFERPSKAWVPVF